MIPYPIFLVLSILGNAFTLFYLWKICRERKEEKDKVMAMKVFMEHLEQLESQIRGGKSKMYSLNKVNKDEIH